MSTLRKRIITAIIGIPILIVIVYFGNPWFTIGIALLSAYATWEFYKLGTLKGLQPLTYFGIATTVLICFSHYCSINNIKLITIILSTIISAICILLRPYKQNAFNDWLWTIGGILYLGLMLSFWSNLRDISDGIWWVFWTIFIIIACDSSAFFAGKKWGKHLLAPTISPKKTWEGAIGGLIGGILASLILGTLFSMFFSFKLSYPEMIIFSTVIIVIAQLSDLFESLLKRNAGVKDTGNFFPGHGGVLDRIDSYIFIGPLIYYYVIYFTI